MNRAAKHSGKHRQLIRDISKKVNRGRYAWAKPYNDLNIKNVDTGLGKGFKYSPIFIKCFAETMIELTGYRSKDYVIAEKKTQTKHIPKVTVWHHAWAEKDGKYLMPLVDFEEHKKTCPHAGGCKLWLLNTKKRSKYLSNKKMQDYGKVGDYSDIPLFYSVDDTERDFFQKDYVSKRTLSTVKRKKARLCGVDMYGNLLYKNNKNIYFWDHENNVLILLNDKRLRG